MCTKHLQLYILYNLDVAQDEAAQYIAQLEKDKRNYFIADLERSSPARIKIWVWERYQITDKGCFVFRLKELIYTVLKIIHKNCREKIDSFFGCDTIEKWI
ncbi:MAG: hypothetical protein A2725_01700 [Candidatus Magasanikbacteria bacterium RIFCSPHIGHO2_01_FULL_33_34]|uniref:Uncharacterized protein n=1 Tax=Candidatus Magasanikbacteria bacterium RIFCSPHIGHO2_01_FULL_33_34 TaxID=1798671 RepID=A0A1F6LJK1_9BACT|nr:MAG: hypothetical protein A2725_01700 [Candidatus Magasanikbacteria bacterium RIFCSPHIGHO2_01_FULL_33_34]OGH65525.1 MAG: hypothetical protein A3B83_01455 [Candidatus Magasanikbacteria bacterium RIFCSPHIGHO2_02_FULL_33_17]OGH76235.1 MAG: hypothetical protein A3A89_02275 [Candidatus Magasanikbacteria bacterium RIFCSPLOWO2_01_FULL_33_34]